MARGGRGGGRGGARGGRYGGAGGDPESAANKKMHRRDPRLTYPPVATPKTPGFTNRERAIVAKYREFRDKIRNGPIYTVIGGNVRVKRPALFSTLRSRAPFGLAPKTDGFSALRTRTDEYHQRVRTMPDVRNMKWFKAYIPQELWPAIDPDIANPETGLTRRKRKARVNVTQLGEDGEEVEAEDDQLDVEQDENWEDEEDEEMDPDEREKDDYNAEQYFDNGEDDDGMGDEDGGGGGGDYE